MSYPYVSAFTTSLNETTNATGARTIPLGGLAGDLILVVVSVDGGSGVTLTWAGNDAMTPLAAKTDNGTSVAAEVRYRIATGSETSFTISTGAASEQLHVQTAIISAADWHGTTPPEAGTPATGDSVSPNPPALVPSWGVEDTTFIAIECHDAQAVLSGYPASYTDFQKTTVGGSSGGTSIGIGVRYRHGVSDDPGVFTIATEQWIAFTIAVRGGSNLQLEITSPTIGTGIDTDYIVAGSLTVGETGDPRRAVMSLVLTGQPGDFDDGHIAEGSTIKWYDGVASLNSPNILFEGTVKQLRKGGYDLAGNVRYTLDCVTPGIDPARYVIDTGGVRSTVETDAQRIAWLNTTFFASAYDLTLVQTLVAAMPVQDFTGKDGAEALDMVMSRSGGTWYMRSTLLYTFLAQTTPAPYGLSDAPNDSTTFGYRDLALSADITGYANAVYLVPTALGTAPTGTWYEDAAAIVIYGRYEDYVEDSESLTQAQLDARGAAILVERVVRTGGTLTVFEPGLRPGQIVEVTNADHGLAAEDFRITGLRTTYHGVPPVPFYQVELGSPAPTLAESIEDTVSPAAVAAAEAAIAADEAAHTVTAFPSSPNTNDRYFRTDLGMWFYFDGTRWLSTTLYTSFFMGPVAEIAATTANLHRGYVPMTGTFGILIVETRVAFFINAGTALSGSHNWVGTIKRDSGSTLATITINSGAVSTWRQDVQVLNGVYTSSSSFHHTVGWTKTGTPGNLFSLPVFTYRIIAT